MTIAFKRISAPALASAVSLLFAGCGGGSGGGSPAATPNSVFLASASSSCQQVQGASLCSAPTSSKAAFANVLAGLTSAQATPLQFTVSGVAEDAFQQLDLQGQQFVATTGQASYTTTEESLVLGGNAVQFRGKAYAFSSATGAGDSAMLSFCASAKDCIYIDPPTFAQGGALVHVHASNLTGGFASATSLGGPSQFWQSTFGLLADANDVAVPANEQISYTGTVTFRGGNGSPLGTRAFNAGVVVCPINLTLNTRNGDVTTQDTSCTNDNGSQLAFALARVVVSSSRVRPVLLGDAATASATKMETAEPGVLASVPAFQSTQISGAVYGSNAASLVVRGHGAAGDFQIVTRRTN